MPTEWLRANTSARLLFVLTAGLTSLLTCCRNQAEVTIRDTEGRDFVVRCSADRICSVEASERGSRGRDEQRPSEARDKPANGRTLRLRSSGRVVGVCGPVSGEPSASDCRPVVCDSASDCPASEGLTAGVCIGGLCTEPSHPMTVDDAVMLCLAGTGVGTRSPQQVERLALGLNCGTPCRIPKPCRQP